MTQQLFVVEQYVAVVVACTQECFPAKSTSAWIIRSPQRGAIDQHAGRFHSCRNRKHGESRAYMSPTRIGLRTSVGSRSHTECEVVLWPDDFEPIKQRSDLLELIGPIPDIVIGEHNLLVSRKSHP